MSRPMKPEDHSTCRVAAQVICSGPVETSIFAVAGQATRPGTRPHVGIKFGRVLIYVEDWAALDRLVGAVERAVTMAPGVFGPPQDAFTEAEADARRRFERTGDVAALR
jgi:hypothetical protein